MLKSVKKKKKSRFRGEVILGYLPGGGWGGGGRCSLGSRYPITLVFSTVVYCIHMVPDFSAWLVQMNAMHNVLPLHVLQLLSELLT